MRSYLVTLADQYVVFDSRVMNDQTPGFTGKKAYGLGLRKRVNAHGQLDLTLPLGHVHYDEASAPTTVVTVSATDQTAPVFTGRVVRSKTGIFGEKTITYAGLSILLTRVMQRPFTYTGAVRGFLDTMLARHNQRSGAEANWVVGSVTGFDAVVLDVTVEEPCTTWDLLVSTLVDGDVHGYLSTHLGSDGTLVVDYTATPGPVSNQTISLASNVIDLESVLDLSSIATRMYPLGAKIKDSDERVTITSVNGGKDYLQDDTLVAVLGVREMSQVFDKADTALEVKSLGAAELERQKLASFTASLTVADLSNLSTDIDQFTVGDRVPVDIPEFGITDTATVTETFVALDDPISSNLVIGVDKPTLTTVTKRTADQVRAAMASNVKLGQSVKTVESSIPAILQKADQAHKAALEADKAAREADQAAQAATTIAESASEVSRTASEDAAKAAGIAEAKADVLIQSATPGVAMRKATTLWIDTTRGSDGVEKNTPKKWDSTVSKWVVVTDQTAVEAAQRAEAADDAANASKQAAVAAKEESEASARVAQAASEAAKAAEAATKTSATSASEAATQAKTAQTAATNAKKASEDAATDAKQAKAASDQAAQDAADAVGIANGKANVLIQTGTPGQGYQLATTLWIDTTGNKNTPKVWDATSKTWVAKTDKTATDAAASAVNAQKAADAASTLAGEAQGLAQSAQESADAAARAAASALDSYSRTAAQGLEGLDFTGSGTVAKAATTVVDCPEAVAGKAIQKPASAAGSLRIHDTLGRIRLKQGVLYEMFVTVRVPTQSPAPSGVCYFGVDGLKQTGDSWEYVNRTGANSSDTQHYFALNGKAVTPGNEFQTFKGYFLAAPVSKTTGHGAQSNDLNQPATIHPAATHVQPHILMSYSGKADLVEVSDWGITAVPRSVQEAAQVAQSTADQAAQKAAEAAGIAGGKADVLIQSTVPETGMRKTTTLWIDTTGSANTPKRWSGTAWVAVTDKAATDAAASAVSAQKAAEGAWTAAQQSNLIKDGCFSTSAASDHVTSSSTSAGADVAATVLVFNATGFTGVLPAPATTYAKTVGNNSYYFRGARGGGEGYPVTPGRAYRLSIDVAHAGTTVGATHPFKFQIAHRKNGEWAIWKGIPLVSTPPDGPDTVFTRYTSLIVIEDGVDSLRPGFSANATGDGNSEWWVTNFSVTDVSEANDAWGAAQQSNLIKDACFSTSSSFDHVTNSLSGAGADVGVSNLEFRATGFTGVLPSPATTYGRVMGNQNVYARGSVGGASGFVGIPGRTYRFMLDVACDGGVLGATKGFMMIVSCRKNGEWSTQVLGRKLLPSDNPATEFTRLTATWTVPDKCDMFRPGFGSYSSTGTNSRWWVTNWSVTDVSEAQDAADAAADVAVTVKTVESNIAQLPDKILTEVSQTYTTKTALTQTAQSIRSEIAQSASDVSVRIQATDESIRRVNGAVIAEATARETVFRFITPGLEIGKTDSKSKLLCADDGIHVTVNGAETAKFADTGAEVSQMTVRDCLQIGNRVFEPNPSGGMWIRKA